MKLLLTLVFSIFSAILAHFDPEPFECTVTANKLFVNGYYVRVLKGSELEEFNKYMEKVEDFKVKVQSMQERREKEDLHMMKLTHRFRRDAKIDENPRMGMDDKPMVPPKEEEENKSDLPTPPEKPSFCKKPEMPLVMGGGCVVIHNKVYIHDQPVRDLTDEEVTQVDKYRKEQEDYVEKWRQVMQTRMLAVGPPPPPQFFNRRRGPMGGRQMSPMGVNKDIRHSKQMSQEQEGPGQQENDDQSNEGPKIQNSSEGPNMQGLNMQGPNMQGSNMQGPNMQGPNMQGLNMQGPNMQGPNMQGPQKMNRPMFGGMNNGMEMDYPGMGSMDNMNESELELPKEPQIPKICAAIV